MVLLFLGSIGDLIYMLVARPYYLALTDRRFFLLNASRWGWIPRPRDPVFTADPEIIQWIMATARAAAEEAGRDPAQLKCIVGAPAHVSGDLADAREQVRWFPAMVSNHVMDLIDRYGADSSAVPKALTDYVQARKFYDYNEHSRVGAKHGEFVTDEICDRFCVLGTAEQAKAKLQKLSGVGVDQFNIYLMTHGQEETLQAFGDEIIPDLANAPA